MHGYRSWLSIKAPDKCLRNPGESCRMFRQRAEDSTSGEEKGHHHVLLAW